MSRLCEVVRVGPRFSRSQPMNENSASANQPRASHVSRNQVRLLYLVANTTALVRANPFAMCRSSKCRHYKFYADNFVAVCHHVRQSSCCSLIAARRLQYSAISGFCSTRFAVRPLSSLRLFSIDRYECSACRLGHAALLEASLADESLDIGIGPWNPTAHHSGAWRAIGHAELANFHASQIPCLVRQ